MTYFNSEIAMNKPVSESIALNFFPLERQEFTIDVFRRPFRDGDRAEDFPGATRWRLPSEGQEDGDYTEYWVTFDPIDDFSPFRCNSRTNNYLTQGYLFWLLQRSCNGLPRDAFAIHSDRFDPRVLFTLERFEEGDQVVWLQPYLLRATGEFGFLVDFSFRVRKPVRNVRRVQQLSLLLDNSGARNTNFYADRFEKLQAFVREYHHRLFPLQASTGPLQVSSRLRSLAAHFLRARTYVVGGNHQVSNTFAGVKAHGPLKAAPEDAKCYFVYRESDRDLARYLYRALSGDVFKTFPGMEAMFGIRMDRQRVGGITTDGFDAFALDRVCRSILADAGSRHAVPIVLVPFSNTGEEADNRAYHVAKHTFLRHGLASQFVSLDRLSSSAKLQWSVSNIALQLFAKLGGQPWKVVPERDRSLIIGLGQAHRIRHGRIERYLAYSILTDSSGLFEDLRVLGESPDEQLYVNQLRSNFETVLRTYADRYDRFVIHASFAIKKRELKALEHVLSREVPASGKQFVVLKFTSSDRFFGYSPTSNSLIPYESTILQLSKTEFLVWFEGLLRTNPKVVKRIERPLHVRFWYPQEGLTPETMRAYLQDAVNLAGANWRGFNGKSLPVSVYYAKRVADYYKEFDELGLERLGLGALPPWFL